MWKALLALHWAVIDLMHISFVPFYLVVKHVCIRWQRESYRRTMYNSYVYGHIWFRMQTHLILWWVGCVLIGCWGWPFCVGVLPELLAKNHHSLQYFILYRCLNWTNIQWQWTAFVVSLFCSVSLDIRVHLTTYMARAQQTICSNQLDISLWLCLS